MIPKREDPAARPQADEQTNGRHDIELLLMPLMTAEELARVLRVHRATVYRWFTEGMLPGIRVGRSIRFLQKDVLRLLRLDETSTKERV